MKFCYLGLKWSVILGFFFLGGFLSSPSSESMSSKLSAGFFTALDLVTETVGEATEAEVV
jgi:hypothetical protein